MTKKVKLGRLKVLTDIQIKDAYENQKQGSWDFYAERAFLENILNQNVNFEVALFGLIIAAAFGVEDKHNQFMIWAFGLVIMLYFFVTSLRVTERLEIVLNILYRLGNKAVFPMVEEEMKRLKWPYTIRTFKYRYNGIPFIFFIIMLFCLWANYCNYFHFDVKEVVKIISD